jgi:hypothetical protein
MRLRGPSRSRPGGERLLGEYRRLVARRAATAVAVDQPLVLISQVQRSGGTLLSQLFDGHPQCHAHPYELKIGHPGKWTWPLLDPAAGAETWWSQLYEWDVRRLFRDGYTKYSAGAANADKAPESFPFLLPPRFQRALFLTLAEQRRPDTSRAIIDTFLTSFFNAWLDNQHLYDGPKRVVTGFTPRLVTVADSVERFFADYPDGTLVSLVREPKAWYASAVRHDPESYAALDDAIGVWEASVNGGLAAREARGDRVLLLTYERLVTDTDAVMRELAARIGIDDLPALRTPTFNGFPIRADSAFDVPEHGITRAPLERAAQLDADTAERIDERAASLYAAVTSD